jgi:hypothetical protein
MLLESDGPCANLLCLLPCVVSSDDRRRTSSSVFAFEVGTIQGQAEALRTDLVDYVNSSDFSDDLAGAGNADLAGVTGVELIGRGAALTNYSTGRFVMPIPEAERNGEVLHPPPHTRARSC